MLKKYLFLVLLVSGCSKGLFLTGVHYHGTPNGNVKFSRGSLATNEAASAELLLDSSKAGDLIRGEVTIRSKVNHTQFVQYQFRWFNDEGVEVSSGASPWQPLELLGLDARHVSSLAPNSSATSYQFVLRGISNE